MGEDWLGPLINLPVEGTVIILGRCYESHERQGHQTCRLDDASDVLAIRV